MTAPTGFWQQLWRWATGQYEENRAKAEAGQREQEVDAIPGQSTDEGWLAELVTAIGQGQRRHEIGGDTFWERIEHLSEAGHERLATEWIEKLIAAQATPPDAALALRVRLVARLFDRGATADALAHLQVLVGHPEHTLRSHFLLGEHYRRIGDEQAALRHYEAVLARDVDYPNVRARVERLRRARGRAAQPMWGNTIAGVDDRSAASGARYHLVQELGRGATGVVYLARDAELERDVAVKLLHPHLAAAHQADACARFFLEARVAASLRHPNILAILDLDERARRIVMELAAGGTLRQVLRERGRRPLRRALERHSQILSALRAAHTRGIVHRDLKPGNLLFRRNPDAPGAEVVLADFGIAHLQPQCEEPARNEATDPVVPTPAAPNAEPRRPALAQGTLAYMSPEQGRGTEADPSADIYASAVVLYEMLTGHIPWNRPGLLSPETRQREDLLIPREIIAEWPADLVEPLQDHLAALGDPQSDGRPDTQSALETARDLRNRATAAAVADRT